VIAFSDSKYRFAALSLLELCHTLAQWNAWLLAWFSMSFLMCLFYWFLVYALGGAERQKVKWREVRAVSVTIKQDSSAERITGRSGQRKSGENANAGRLARKGKPDRTESRLRIVSL